jgi:predicted ArsR family transcriptional regulator
MSKKEESPTGNAQILREILKWSRFENFPKLRKLLLDTLATDVEKLVYELTDGERSRYDIVKELGIQDSIVRSWWDGWYNLGILEPSGKRKGRPQKVMALEDMGIDVPKIPQKKPEVKEEKTTKTESKSTEKLVTDSKN